MSACRICGNEIRPGESIAELGDDEVHQACVGDVSGDGDRKIGRWSFVGSRGQMGMGEPQRGD